MDESQKVGLITAIICICFAIVLITYFLYGDDIKRYIKKMKKRKKQKRYNSVDNLLIRLLGKTGDLQSQVDHQFAIMDTRMTNRLEELENVINDTNMMLKCMTENQEKQRSKSNTSKEFTISNDKDLLNELQMLRADVQHVKNSLIMINEYDKTERKIPLEDIKDVKKKIKQITKTINSVVIKPDGSSEESSEDGIYQSENIKSFYDSLNHIISDICLPGMLSSNIIVINRETYDKYWNDAFRFVFNGFMIGVYNKQYMCTDEFYSDYFYLPIEKYQQAVRLYEALQTIQNTIYGSMMGGKQFIHTHQASSGRLLYDSDVIQNYIRFKTKSNVMVRIVKDYNTNKKSAIGAAVFYLPLKVTDVSIVGRERANFETKEAYDEFQGDTMSTFYGIQGKEKPRIEDIGRKIMEESMREQNKEEI